ncbi:hypothetical protein BZARG_2593 [Bizionia argentinensis JUB59]|uniref:Uncharacterized protein n=1 Tax=Bizionia argentinensis JUB59 TaxID=1046627 RepID=G2EGX6_9FLAO|nr:hypothetical protein [Bizionia argentinensis]EGV42347.1 hypothetical protein BZARG_2593 [Bizionia argentinensis JUB59]
MESKPFFNHNTDEEIILAKRTQELDVWISHLTYVTDESDWLAQIASKKLNDETLKDELLEKSEQNTIIINELYTYRGSIENYNECDNLECDIYYVNLHDTFCSKYVKHLEAYRNLKNELYKKLLN